MTQQYREGVAPTTDDVRARAAQVRAMHRAAYMANNPYAAVAAAVAAAAAEARHPWEERAAFVGSFAPEAFGNRSLPRANNVYGTVAPTVDEARERARFVREAGLVPTYGGSTPSAALNTTAPGFWASRLGNEVAQRQRRALPDIIG